jgi:hypothetical protein
MRADLKLQAGVFLGFLLATSVAAMSQIHPVPYLLRGINQIRSPQMPPVGQNQGIRYLCMHLNMHLAQERQISGR